MVLRGRSLELRSVHEENQLVPGHNKLTAQEGCTSYKEVLPCSNNEGRFHVLGARVILSRAAACMSALEALTIYWKCSEAVRAVYGVSHPSAIKRAC